MPVFNGAEWLEDSLSPLLQQTFKGNLEVSIYNDGSLVCNVLVTIA